VSVEPPTSPRLAGQSLSERAASLDERAAALAREAQALRQREGEARLGEGARRLIDQALIELRLHNDELRAANAELVMATLDAQALRDAAQATARRQDEFLAMLAHELRNPLQPISAGVEILARLGAKPVPESILGMIRRQVRQMVRLLDDLLDASRLTEGKIKLQPQRIAFGEVVAQAAETVNELMLKKRQSLALDLPSLPIFIDGDSARMVQIVSNLLQNAAKYTPEGGAVSVGVRQEGGRVVLRVVDNGMGIAPEALPHVFDLFVQDPRALSRAEGGMGIGLTVVRRLVAMHGGTVDAHSRGRDQGSEFVVTLPSAARAADAVPGADESPRAVSPTGILVIEDNVDACDAMAELLRMHGHDVSVARDGVDGMEQFNALLPRVVLCDIGLPGIDGYEVARRVRARAHEPRPILVAVTGYGGTQASEAAIAAGFDRHVVKPVDPDALMRLIDALLPAADVEGTPPGSQRRERSH